MWKTVKWKEKGWLYLEKERNKNSPRVVSYAGFTLNFATLRLNFLTSSIVEIINFW
jgi:hypothetical protein